MGDSLGDVAKSWLAGAVLPDGLFFEPKIWVNFGRPSIEDIDIFMAILSILLPNGVALGYIWWSFGIFFSVLICCNEKKWATRGAQVRGAFLQFEFDVEKI
jgi:hypothetical protein